MAQADLSSQTHARVRRHVLSQLVCLGRHSITGLITTVGRQFMDWSAEYRLYSHERVEPDDLFPTVRRAVAAATPSSRPLVAAMDDTLLRRRGRHMPGAQYLRDPLGPPFRPNLVYAQRCLQLSLALPGGSRQARMVPIDFVPAPPAPKPRRNADPQVWADYRQRRRQQSLAQLGVDRLHVARAHLDADGEHDRPFWVAVDGSYTNRTVLRRLPERTVLIGRIRADAKLYALPAGIPGRGRRRVYGAPLPTPDAVRRDPDIPWTRVQAFAAGHVHRFKINTLPLVRWRASGLRALRLIIIAPLAYRRSRNARALYRKPAYLICTDPNAPLADVLQAYLWRWDIEVNFKEEKSLLGIGQAKVRHPSSAARVPALAVAAYGLLLAAAAQAFGPDRLPQVLPPPKWRRGPQRRPSTQNLINHLRHELWCQGMRLSHFVSPAPRTTKCHKIAPALESAVYYTVAAG